MIGALARTVAMSARPMGQTMQKRTYAKGTPLYNYVFKSNVTYVTFVLVGAAIGGGAYSAGMDFIWRSLNRGRLYDQIDWSKWNSNWKPEDE